MVRGLMPEYRPDSKVLGDIERATSELMSALVHYRKHGTLGASEWLLQKAAEQLAGFASEMGDPRRLIYTAGMLEGQERGTKERTE